MRFFVLFGSIYFCTLTMVGKTSDSNAPLEQVSRGPSAARITLSHDLVTNFGAKAFLQQACERYSQWWGTLSPEFEIDFEEMVGDLASLYACSYQEEDLRKMVKAAQYNMEIEEENPIHRKILDTLVKFQQENLFNHSLRPLQLYLRLKTSLKTPPLQ